MEGLAQAQAGLNRELRRIGGATRAEVVEFGLAVLGEAAYRAPVDTGDLRASLAMEVDGAVWASGTEEGAVDVHRSGDPGEGRAVIRIGTSGIPYAARQHEELGYNHPKGGEAKYLENPVNELAPRLIERIKARIQREGGGNT
jgi:hypothetical protein